MNASERLLERLREHEHGPGPLVLDGLDDALRALDRFPRIAPSGAPAPELVVGDHLAPLPDAEARVAPISVPPPDAAVSPALDALPPLTRALITMLRAARPRPEPVAATLALIRFDTPLDVRAYIHAWAIHDLSYPTVYEWWLRAPTRLSHNELQLGSFASGEPIISSGHRLTMLDDEGVPYQYGSIEGLLENLRERAGGELELDRWMD